MLARYLVPSLLLLSLAPSGLYAAGTGFRETLLGDSLDPRYWEIGGIPQGSAIVCRADASGERRLYLWGAGAPVQARTRDRWPTIAHTIRFRLAVPQQPELAGRLSVSMHRVNADKFYSYPDLIYDLEFSNGSANLTVVRHNEPMAVWSARCLEALGNYDVELTATVEGVRVEVRAGAHEVASSGWHSFDACAPAPVEIAASGPGADTGRGYRLGDLSVWVPAKDRVEYRFRASILGGLKTVPAIRQSPALSALREALRAIGEAPPEDSDAWAAAMARFDAELGRIPDWEDLSHAVERAGLFYFLKVPATGESRDLSAPKGIPLVWLETIPFLVPPEQPAAAITPLEDSAQISVPVGRSAREIYLLMSVEMLQAAPVTSSHLSWADVGVVEVRYEDGRIDRCVPRCLPSGRVGLDPGRVAAYAIQPRYRGTIREIRIIDTCHWAAFSVFAVTGSDRALLAPEPLRSARVTPVRWPTTRKAPRVRQDPGGIIIENSFYRLRLHTRAGLRLSSMVNFASNGEYLGSSGAHASPIFLWQQTKGTFPYWTGDPAAGNKHGGDWGPHLGPCLSSEDFRVVDTAVQSSSDAVTCRLRLESLLAEAPLSAELTLTADATDETRWRLALTNAGTEPLIGALYFPCLMNLRAAVDPGDLWYFAPNHGGVLTNVPALFTAGYGATGHFQVFDAFDASRGGGVYVRVEDATGRDKVLHSFKPDGGRPTIKAGGATYTWPKSDAPFKFTDGIGFSVSYLVWQLAPGETEVLPDVIIGVHPGDWRVALDAYRGWCATWRHPRRTPRWFREAKINGIFTDRSQNKVFGDVAYHMYPGSYGDAPIMTDQQITDFKNAIRDQLDRGVPFGTYTEGILMGRSTQVGKEHGLEWSLLGPHGEEYGFFGPEAFFNLCPKYEPWQSYMGEVATTLSRRMGVDFMYLDEIGCRTTELCFNPLHAHSHPDNWNRGCAEMGEMIRRALDATGRYVCVLSEERGSDYVSQFFDGSLSYTLWSLPEGMTACNPTSVEFWRFCFPDFMMLQLSYENHLAMIKRTFFNGSGFWGQATNPVTVDYIKRIQAIYDLNRSNFATGNPYPLWPTGVDGVYCNLFPGRSKTLYTLISNLPRTESISLPVRPAPGHHFVELVWHRECPILDQGQAAAADWRISADVQPGDVACIAALPQRLNVRLEGSMAVIRVDEARSADVIEILPAELDAVPVRTLRAGGDCVVDLREALGDAAPLAAIRLVRRGDLVDEVVVSAPRLGPGGSANARPELLDTRTGPEAIERRASP